LSKEKSAGNFLGRNISSIIKYRVGKGRFSTRDEKYR